MTDSKFKILLVHASNTAWDFAKIYTNDDLPEEFKYSLRLNISTDNIELDQFDIYPNDDKKIIDSITADKVVNVLNRKGKVPVWIDISVVRVHKKFTIFQLLCAGRYSSNENEFYYLQNGTGPFGIKSPRFPVDYIEGIKFNLTT